jgi:DNA-binding transcriptional ArsR family regulator
MTLGRVAPPLPEGRRAVLYALRRRGQATADDIARQLDMTVSGARQHLAALVDDGFAEAAELPRPAGQRGRAQLAYTVTDRADALFPKAYGELTNELLGYASESDSGLVDTLFARRRDERIRNATERLARKRTHKAKAQAYRLNAVRQPTSTTNLAVKPLARMAPTCMLMATNELARPRSRSGIQSAKTNAMHGIKPAWATPRAMRAWCSASAVSARLIHNVDNDQKMLSAVRTRRGPQRFPSQPPGI